MAALAADHDPAAAEPPQDGDAEAGSRPAYGERSTGIRPARRKLANAVCRNVRRRARHGEKVVDHHHALNADLHFQRVAIDRPTAVKQLDTIVLDGAG